MGSQCQRYLKYVEWVEGIPKQGRCIWCTESRAQAKEQVFPTGDD